MTRPPGATGDRPVHYESHQALLSPVSAASDRRLDGIVVAATRGVAHLMPALRLAAALDVPVVAMCSESAHAEAAAEFAARMSPARCTVLDFARGPTAHLPPFRTSKLPAARAGAHGDLSSKRNSGLLLGRAAGWSTVLFLDDDIYGLDPGVAADAVAILDQHAAVGMRARMFPDNSVVCHARRFVPGNRQDVFVSGSALAVRVDRADSFFPRVYNEDWLFLAPALDRREVAAVGTVNQLTYQPFRTSNRAADQEFGDVLAEGLAGHLHAGSLDDVPGAEYWHAFLHRRGEFIREAAASCAENAHRDPVARAALRALDRADRVRAGIDPGTLRDYVTTWRADLEQWRTLLDIVPCLGTLEAAIRWLGLPVVTASSHPSSRRSSNAE